MNTETQKTTPKSVLDDVKSLRALRDELRLQAHLLKAEAKDKLEILEKRWYEVERIGGTLEAESKDTAKELIRTAKETLTDLRSQYHKLKSELEPKH